MVKPKKVRNPKDPPKNYEVVPGQAEEAEGTIHPPQEESEKVQEEIENQE